MLNREEIISGIIDRMDEFADYGWWDGEDVEEDTDLDSFMSLVKKLLKECQEKLEELY